MEVYVRSPKALRQKNTSSYEKIEAESSSKSENEAGGWQGSIFLMFVVFGITSLTPWNMFIAATAYFQDKFSGSTPDIEENFPNYFQTGAICMEVLVSFLAMPLVRYIPIPALIYTANALMLSMFGLTAILAKVDTSAWAEQLFFLTEVCFCVMCGSGALYISTMFAITSAMNPMYIQAFVIGLGSAGVIASLLNIIFLSIPGIDFVEAGFWYFSTAAVLLIFSMVLFSYFHRHHYQPLPKQTPAEEEEGDSAGLKTSHSSMFQLTKNTLALGYTIFFDMFLNFLLFPGVLSTLESKSTDPSWTSRYFLPVSLFLTYNVGCLVGTMLSRLIQFPSRGLIPWYATIRIVFVLLLVMCNLQPRSLPVWFQDDISPTIFLFLFAVTQGQVLPLSLQYASESGNSSREKASIGTIMGFHSAIGRIGGSLATYLIFMIIK